MTKRSLFLPISPFLSNQMENFIIPLIKEFGPLAFALSLTSFLDAGFFKTFIFAFKVLILSVSLTILYQWVYIANEFVTKFEPPEVRTIRFGGAVTVVDIIIALLTRTFMSQLIILLCLNWGIFSLHEYTLASVAEGLLIFLMTLHQITSWEMRSLSTLPMLRILRILNVFLPLTAGCMEKCWMFVYAFAITLPHSLNYFGSKLIRSKLKTNEYTLIFSRKTYTIQKSLFHMSLVFSIFLVISPFIFTDLEPLKMVIYPASILVYLCICEMTKRALLSLDILNRMRA